MALHVIPGTRDKDGNQLTTSDQDGDSHNRQTVYRENKRGITEEVKGVKYDPQKKQFKK